MFAKRLYRVYAPDTLFARLDSLKQSNLYVDIREDGVHAPTDDQNLKRSLDFLLVFGQERADSFRSWHVTTKRSSDELEVALGRRALANWTSSYTIQEVEGDILYHASSLSASQVPDYYTFRDFVREYRKKPSKDYFEQALLHLAVAVRGRLIATSDLSLYYARSIGLLKMLVGLTDPDTLLGRSFSRKLRETLLKKV